MEFWICTVATVYRNNIIVKQEILRNEAKLVNNNMYIHVHDLELSLVK